MLDRVARLGLMAEQAEDEARDRVVVLDGQVDPELLVEVVDRERPVDVDRLVVDPLDRLVREVELVLDLADDLLEQVLERDDPLEAAVLVDDDRHVLAGAAELREERGEVLRLRHHVRRAEQRLDVTCSSPRSESAEKRSRTWRIPTMSLDRPAVDRVARVGRVDHRGEAVLGGQVDRERDDLGRGTITSATSLSAKSKTL